mgnify:CR=1 FL=1
MKRNLIYSMEKCMNAKNHETRVYGTYFGIDSISMNCYIPGLIRKFDFLITLSS